jgi:hypothetical protein
MDMIFLSYTWGFPYKPMAEKRVIHKKFTFLKLALDTLDGYRMME